MVDIAFMTTINHEHLFASLLRALPFGRISEEDFKRRAFLLTDLAPDKTAPTCHQSLHFGQVALLTDDRYHKYRNFLELAKEADFVHCERGILFRNAVGFYTGRKSNRIQIENPFAVTTNELRWRSCLKHRVRLLAWLPEMIVRHRVSEIILRQAAEQFEADYAQFYHPGESKERAVGAPILLKGSSRRLGVVLVHGFLATPREVLELAEYLHSKGFWVYCVRLRGHGTSPEDLGTRERNDWIESVDLGYAIMSASCRRVVVGGFSFGGGLALDAAARITGLAGVFAVCPPFRLQSLSSRFAPIVTTWNRTMDTMHCHGVTKEYAKRNSERPLINYERVPLAALSQLERFMKGLEARVADIKAPTLVIQAVEDPIVNHKGTELVFNRIGAEQKRYLTFHFSRHGILAGEGSEKVHAAIAAFIDKL